MVIFRDVKGYDNYSLCNDGFVFNKNTGTVLKPFKTSKAAKQYYVVLYEKSKGKPFNLAKLILDHFTPEEIGKDNALHLNYKTEENHIENLKRGTRGDLLRHYNQGKKRGVVKYISGNYKYWRAIINKDQKTITVGYFKNKQEAEMAYCLAYAAEYDQLPF
jgi:hypothetical protein